MRRLLSNSLHKSLLKQILLLFIVLLLSVGAGTSILFAQDASTGAVTADEVNVIARELWCPLCSGVRLDSCELKACEQMKDVIAIKLEQGEDLDSIKAYFFDQYGPQVLGEPPLEGFSWLAWILPVAVLIGGGYLIWSRMKLMVKPATQTAAGQSATIQTSDVSVEDAAKLRKELERYG